MMYYGGSLFSVFFFFFKQKTAYEMRISDWSSDVCSSDLAIVASASAQTEHIAAFQMTVFPAAQRQPTFALDHRAGARLVMRQIQFWLVFELAQFMTQQFRREVL